jgi:hypothetical protein
MVNLLKFILVMIGGEINCWLRKNNLQYFTSIEGISYCSGEMFFTEYSRREKDERY